MATAVEEIVRWASPVIHFRCTALADTEIAGVPIKEGQKTEDRRLVQLGQSRRRQVHRFLSLNGIKRMPCAFTNR